MLGKRARPVRAGGRRKRARARRHLADGLPVLAHGDGKNPVDFLLFCDPDTGIRIEVDDHSPWTMPELEAPGPDDENGRGLLLVTALAQAWGRAGTYTWCTVAAPGTTA